MNPSLLLIPDRYKAAKLYSQVPDSGAGDLTFARNSNATRVNSAGLIEKVRTNLILYSEQFNDAAWAANLNASATANATTAPNGTATADKIVEDTSTSQHYFGQTPTSITGVGHTISVFAKAAERSFLFLFEDSAGGRSAYFDLSNGTIGTIGGSATASITSVGNGWYRCSVTYTASGTLVRMRVATATANGTNSYTGDGTSGIFVWGAQVEVSDFGATDYIPTTTAAVSVGITANIPRLDYTGGGCPSLLLEPQRTNLLLNNLSIIGNTGSGQATPIISPDGYENGRLPIPSATTNRFEFVFVGGTFASGTVLTYSWFVKTVSTPVSPSPTTGQLTEFTLSENATAGTPTKMADYGNGWERWSITYTVINGALTIRLRAYYGGVIGIGNSSVAYYGHQVEQGTYATSLIPTLGSSVTRLADAASKTGISSLIGQTSGTLYVEVNIQNTLNRQRLIAVISSANPGTTTSEAYIWINASGNLAFEFITAGAPQAIISAGAVQAGIQKLAFAYANNDFVFYRNGSVVGSDNAGTIVSGFDRIFVGCFTNSLLQINDRINTAALYPVRLSNSELASLTSL